MTTIKDFEHTQVTPAHTWIINHKLNTESPVVDVYIEVDGTKQKILPLKVEIVNPNTCQVKFSTNRSGTARVM